jgi:hypothetical protein
VTYQLNTAELDEVTGGSIISYIKEHLNTATFNPYGGIEGSPATPGGPGFVFNAAAGGPGGPKCGHGCH